MSLYSSIDEKEFWLKSKSLLPYGGVFTPAIITKAKGVYIYTHDGKRILDFTSGQMSCLLGHGHPEISKTITEHAFNLDHLFSGMICPPVVNLAHMLTGILPDGLDKAMFLSTGGEANEAAIKLAKICTGNFEVVGLSLSWHGMTGASNATTYQSGRSGQGPMIPGNLVLPAPNGYRSIFRKPDGSYDWETELDYGWSLIDSASVGSLAAVIVEPILSSGGMLVLPDGYLRAMKKHCEKRGMLLIVDEAQTALGRCGSMFAFGDSGVIPDILSLSKTLGNGIPLSAIVTSEQLSERGNKKGFLFYTTHVNDPLPAAVGLKVLEVIIRDNLVDKARIMGNIFKSELDKFKQEYNFIGDIRGKGLMVGIEIVKNRQTKESDPDLAKVLADKMMELGLSANLIAVASFGGIFRIAPPITVTEEELRHGLSIMNDAFRAIRNQL